MKYFVKLFVQLIKFISRKKKFSNMKYPVIEISRISTMIKFAYHCFFIVKIFFNFNQTSLLSSRFSISFGLFNTKNTRFETSPFTYYFNLTRDHYRIKCDMIQFSNICFLTFPTNCNEGWKKKERERSGARKGGETKVGSSN